MNLLRRAKERFGFVVASLNTDEFVRRYKGLFPNIPLMERMAVVAACRYVDQVIVNTGDEDSKPAILACGATHIIHGDDWTGSALMHQMGLDKFWLAEHEIKMVYLPYTRGVSSTQIRKGRTKCSTTSASRSLARTI